MIFLLFYLQWDFPDLYLFALKGRQCPIYNCALKIFMFCSFTSFIFICGFSVNNNRKFIRMKSQKNDVIFHILIKLRFKSTGARLLEITLTVPLICKWRHRYCHKQVDFGKSCETNWLILITIILPHDMISHFYFFLNHL